MRSRNLLLLGISVVVVLALAVGGWLWMSSRTADGVHVSWRDGDPTCTGTTVEYKEKYDARVFDAVPEMQCTVRVEIHNDSDRSVHLDQLVAPYVGSTTGTVVTARGAEPDTESGGIDAVFALDDDLDAGDSTSLDIVLVFHPEGCNDSGTMWIDSWPSVSFESLGRTHDRAAAERLTFSRDGKTPGCKVL